MIELKPESSCPSNRTVVGVKRIVHLVLLGPVTDGFSYQDNLLTKYQRRDGHDVTIITSQWVWGQDGKIVRFVKSDYINEDGVRVIRLPMFGWQRFSRKFKRFRGLYKAIEECNPEILFVHGVSFLDVFIIVRFLRRHPDVIAYADNHSDFNNSATNWLSKNILHKIVWRTCARAFEPYVRKFYGVLPARVDFLTDVYRLPPEKCELLILGADDDEVDAANRPWVKKEIREKHGISADDFLVMTGGKIDKWKLQTLSLMEAVQRIPEERLKLIVFGSVEDKIREQVLHLSDGKRVQYIGWIPTKDTYRYFAAADLVVFPGYHSTLWEEAAALGVPLLCKDLPGTHHIDLGGNVGFLKDDSAEEIQDMIEALLNRPEEYQHMKMVAVEKGRKTFSYQEIARIAIESQYS